MYVFSFYGNDLLYNIVFLQIESVIGLVGFALMCQITHFIVNSSTREYSSQSLGWPLSKIVVLPN